MSVTTLMIAPPNSMVLIEDVGGGTPREMARSERIAATPSCILVGCRVYQDGDTELALGPARDVPHEGATVFDGVLETPNGALRIATIAGTVLASQTVGAPNIRVRVWTNHATEPDRVSVGLGDGPDGSPQEALPAAVATLSVAPPYSLLVIDDSFSGNAPDDVAPGVTATPSCLLVGCLMFQDGDTEVTLGPATEVPHKGDIVFDGLLETPNRLLSIATVHYTLISKQTVTTLNTRVRVWTNHPTEPDRVIVGWGDGA